MEGQRLDACDLASLGLLSLFARGFKNYIHSQLFVCLACFAAEQFIGSVHLSVHDRAYAYYIQPTALESVSGERD